MENTSSVGRERHLQFGFWPTCGRTSSRELPGWDAHDHGDAAQRCGSGAAEPRHMRALEPPGGAATEPRRVSRSLSYGAHIMKR